MTTTDDGITLGEVARTVARIEARQQLDEGKYVLVTEFKLLVEEVHGIRKLFARIAWLLATNLVAGLSIYITTRIH